MEKFRYEITFELGPIKTKKWASTMVQQVKAPAVKTGDLDSIPRT